MITIAGIQAYVINRRRSHRKKRKRKERRNNVLHGIKLKRKVGEHPSLSLLPLPFLLVSSSSNLLLQTISLSLSLGGELCLVVSGCCTIASKTLNCCSWDWFASSFGCRTYSSLSLSLSLVSLEEQRIGGNDTYWSASGIPVPSHWWGTCCLLSQEEDQWAQNWIGDHSWSRSLQMRTMGFTRYRYPVLHLASGGTIYMCIVLTAWVYGDFDHIMNDNDHMNNI